MAARVESVTFRGMGEREKFSSIDFRPASLLQGSRAIAPHSFLNILQNLTPFFSNFRKIKNLIKKSPSFCQNREKISISHENKMNAISSSNQRILNSEKNVSSSLNRQGTYSYSTLKYLLPETDKDKKKM